MKCGPCGGGTAKKLDKQVTVKRIKTGLTPDAAGHIDETNEANWITYGTFYCEIVTKGSREFFRGEQVNADITHQITIRHSTSSAGITTSMKLVYQGRTFNISEPPRNVNEDNEWLVFGAVEVK